jgi:hypothetical protein
VKEQTVTANPSVPDQLRAVLKWPTATDDQLVRWVQSMMHPSIAHVSSARLHTVVVLSTEEAVLFGPEGASLLHGSTTTGDSDGEPAFRLERTDKTDKWVRDEVLRALEDASR